MGHPSIITRLTKTWRYAGMIPVARHGRSSFTSRQSVELRLERRQNSGSFQWANQTATLYRGPSSVLGVASKSAPSAQTESLVNNNAGIALADSDVQTRAYELRGRKRSESPQPTSVVDPNVRKNLSKALRETHAA